MDIKLITYVQSESEFDRASKQGFWETVRGFFTQRDTRLLSFNEVVGQLKPAGTRELGTQDVPVEDIVGSAGRQRDFTRHFLPRVTDSRSKDRWRNIYTLAVTGQGFPPIEVYKVGPLYFVEDGHHRVSVANYLDWQTIQAHVTEVPLDSCAEQDFYHCLGWREAADQSSSYN